MKTLEHKNGLIQVLIYKSMREQQDDKLNTPIKLSNILKGLW